MPSPTRLAAIDIGTNSFHLIVAEARPNGKFTVLGREKEVIRLGEGSSDMKRLGAAAMDRGMEALRRFSLIAEQHDARVRAVATSAVREASNRDVFVERVRAELGLEIEVISGFEEARLIYIGVLQALPVYNKTALLVDIGGGSTEFLVGKAGEVQYVNSLKLGAVRLSNRFFQEKTVRARDVDACRAFLAGELNPIERTIRSAAIDVAVGSSGTIINTAAMILAAQGREDTAEEGNAVITRRELARVVETVLAAGTLTKRRQIDGLDPARADIIVAGVLLLEQIFERLHLKEMVTSKYALREGVILDTITKTPGHEDAGAHLRNIRRTSVLHLGESCRYEARHGAAVARYALSIFDQTRGLHKLGSAERELLEAAALLHDIGYHISHSLHHRHSWYIIRYAELLGFTEREKDVIANVARYHRKSHPKPKHENFAALAEQDRTVVLHLSAILRIADGLDRRHRAVFSSVVCEQTRDTMTFQLHRHRAVDCSLEVWGAERRKDLFEQLYGLRTVFTPEQSEKA